MAEFDEALLSEDEKASYRAATESPTAFTTTVTILAVLAVAVGINMAATADADGFGPKVALFFAGLFLGGVIDALIALPLAATVSFFATRPKHRAWLETHEYNHAQRLAARQAELNATRAAEKAKEDALRTRIDSDDSPTLTRREVQHQWYGSGNSDLDWRDRELGEALGIPDGDTYKNNFQD